jgi:hypothetical protein
MVGGECSTESDSMRFRSSLVSKPLTQGVASGSEQDVFVLDNAFALIDEYICADQPVTLTFRLRQGGGPYIPDRRQLLPWDCFRMVHHTTRIVPDLVAKACEVFACLRRVANFSTIFAIFTARSVQRAPYSKGGNVSSTHDPGRVARVWYLLLTVIGPLRLIYIPNKLFVPGHATATVNSIAAPEWLFRFGIIWRRGCRLRNCRRRVLAANGYKIAEANGYKIADWRNRLDF